MFSANPSISPTKLKPLDVAKGRGNGGEQGWTRLRTGLDGAGNGVGQKEWDWTEGLVRRSD